MTDLADATLFNPRFLQQVRNRAIALVRASVARCANRPPDEIIGDPRQPYLYRWHRIRRNRWLNIYVHQFLRSDDDRALHDHPWPSLSLVLSGSYVEHEIRAGGVHVPTLRKMGDLIFRLPSSAHRIELPKESSAPCWTLFVTGPKVREWGFHRPDRWVHWTEFDGQDNPLSTPVGLPSDQRPDALPTRS